MATALARMLEDEQDLETLILCPKNRVSMWQDYRERYGPRGKVLSYTRVLQELPSLKRYRLLVLTGGAVPSTCTVLAASTTSSRVDAGELTNGQSDSRVTKDRNPVLATRSL